MNIIIKYVVMKQIQDRRSWSFEPFYPMAKKRNVAFDTQHEAEAAIYEYLSHTTSSGKINCPVLFVQKTFTVDKTTI